MFHKKQKVLCYVLIYDQFDIIKRSLKFLTLYSDQLELVVIENPSSHSPQIKLFLDELGNKHLIDRHYIMEANIAANAYAMVLEKEREIVNSRRFVIITDGDIDSTHTYWLREELSILRKHRVVFACGITLELSNLPLKTYPNAREEWIPVDRKVYKDYAEVTTGLHLLMLRGHELMDFLDWKNANRLNFVDGNMHRYCSEVRKQEWARTKKASAYHITWDLYNDPEHPYTKLKMTKSFDEIWHNNKRSDYSLIKY